MTTTTTDAIATDEARGCSRVTFYGSNYPDSPRFGPDEYCDNEAQDGSDYCSMHDDSDDDDYDGGNDDDYDDDPGFDYYPDL